MAGWGGGGGGGGGMGMSGTHGSHCTPLLLLSTGAGLISLSRKALYWVKVSLVSAGTSLCTVDLCVDCGHRRRMTENKAKCRRFGLGVKIKCRTWKFWCESVALCA